MIPIDLSGKNVLITGGTRGIGRAISLRLATAGARIGAIYRADIAAANEAVALLADVSGRNDHFAMQADIADQARGTAAALEVVERFGGSVDILVFDAASGAGGTVEQSRPDDWERAFAVNVHGHVAISRAALPAMRRGGSVVFISSGAGHDPIAGLGAYGASKAAVNHLAAVMAQEWGPKGIRVNVVSPGHTAMKPVDYANLTDHQRETVEGTALRRLGTPEDVANVVLFFVSDLAGFVTGQALRVNGGRV